MSTVIKKAVKTDVLIVGYGPVGATMACFMGKYGIDTLVIDRANDILMMPRAIALDNEALRILQNAGVAEDAFAKHTIKEVVMRSPLAGVFGRGNTSGSIDGHPKLVTFYQPELERALRNKVATHSRIKTHLSTTLVSFEDKGDYVHAVIESADGQQQTVICRYLVAADGASSTIREQLGLSFSGESYSEDWLIVDAIHRDTSKMDYVEFVCSPKLPAPHMAAPGGRERWEFMLGKGLSRERALEDSFIREQLKKWVGVEPVEIERKAVYKFHARCSKSFSKGQVFLVGDAAHITPPFVGQGLVAGLRDVSNLSWKLAWVLSGHCDARILNSYDRERRPHANSIINLARRMGSLVMPGNYLRAAVIHNAMKSLRLIPTIRHYLEELEVKPKNEFKNGLFTRRFEPGQTALRAGGLIPQGLLRQKDGSIGWSDDLLTGQFYLLGIGIDPKTIIGDAQASILEQMGGSVANITARKGGKPLKDDELEDLENIFTDKTHHKPILVLLRPDKIIMGLCEPDQLASMLRSLLPLWQPSLNKALAA